MCNCRDHGAYRESYTGGLARGLRALRQKGGPADVECILFAVRPAGSMRRSVRSLSLGLCDDIDPENRATELEGGVVNFAHGWELEGCMQTGQCQCQEGDEQKTEQQTSAVGNNISMCYMKAAQSLHVGRRSRVAAGNTGQERVR